MLVSLLSSGYRETSVDPVACNNSPWCEDPGVVDCRLLPPCGRDGNFALHFHCW